MIITNTLFKTAPHQYRFDFPDRVEPVFGSDSDDEDPLEGEIGAQGCDAPEPRQWEGPVDRLDVIEARLNRFEMRLSDVSSWLERVSNQVDGPYGGRKKRRLASAIAFSRGKRGSSGSAPSCPEACFHRPASLEEPRSRGRSCSEGDGLPLSRSAPGHTPFSDLTAYQAWAAPIRDSRPPEEAVGADDDDVGDDEYQHQVDHRHEGRTV